MWAVAPERWRSSPGDPGNYSDEKRARLGIRRLPTAVDEALDSIRKRQQKRMASVRIPFFFVVVTSALDLSQD